MVKNNSKVLIVEDDRPTLEAVVFKLKKKGIRADFAIHGEEALEKVKKETYKLILLDLLLPKKNGFEVLEEIKHNKKNEKTKIIIFSNLVQKEDISRAKLLGAHDFISKADMSIEKLTERILNELGT